MNQDTKSSASFSPRSRRPHRGSRHRPRRPHKPAAQTNAQGETVGTSAPLTETASTVAEPLAEPIEGSPSSEGVPGVDVSTPDVSTPSSLPVAEGTSTLEQSPEAPPSQYQDRGRHAPQRHAGPPSPPAKIRSLQEASREVLAIIDRLNDVLCEMEHLAKLLDDLEVQQRSDEQEIQSLRNALRQFQNPPKPRPESDRHRDRGRSGGNQRGRDRYRERRPEQRQNAPVESPPPQAASEAEQPTSAEPATPEDNPTGQS